MEPRAVFWLSQRAEEVPSSDDWLSASEQHTLAALHVPKRRQDWRLGRWTAKRAVGAYLAAEGIRRNAQGQSPHLPTFENTDESLDAVSVLAPCALRFAPDRGLSTLSAGGGIEIRAAVSGAPEVFIRGQLAPLVISISHTADLALCAVAPAHLALGCDVERIEPRTAAFVRDYFTDMERAVIDGAPAEERDRLVTLLWSAKESALKALREGLRYDPRDVEASIHDWRRSAEVDWQPVSVRHVSSRRLFDGWWRSQAGTVITLVATPPMGLPIRLAQYS